MTDFIADLKTCIERVDGVSVVSIEKEFDMTYTEVHVTVLGGDNRSIAEVIYDARVGSIGLTVVKVRDRWVRFSRPTMQGEQ